MVRSDWLHDIWKVVQTELDCRLLALVSADPSDGFAESRVTNLDDLYPSGHPSFTEEYGYMSDSGLEDDETLVNLEDTRERLHPINGDAQSTRVYTLSFICTSSHSSSCRLAGPSASVACS